jgi:hypothetical protein
MERRLEMIPKQCMFSDKIMRCDKTLEHRTEKWIPLLGSLR